MKGFITRQDGFTLIELLVVILILAILIAVAAPSFLGQVSKAHDSESKQNLAIAYKAAKSSSIDRPSQGQWTDTPDEHDAYTGLAGTDSRPDPLTHASSGAFDEESLIQYIIDTEPQFASIVDPLPLSAGASGGIDEADAVSLIESTGEPWLYFGVTCGAPGDCSQQTLHIYSLSKSGKVFKIEAPANGAIEFKTWNGSAFTS